MKKLKRYKPTRFMAKGSYYDEEAADYAVNFIECLCHTKGTWAGKPFELIDWQEQIIRDLFGTIKPNGYRQFNAAYIEIPKKQGKQLDVRTPIPTPTGWSTMGELKVGDLVFDEHGDPCHVVAKSALDDTEQAYRLTFRDGTSIIAGENHLWDVEDIYFAKPKRVVYKTVDIYNRTRQKLERNKDNPVETRRSVIRIPITEPLHTGETVLPIDPYLYGYWLGNGHSTKPEITVSDADLGAVMRRIPYRAQNLYPQKCGGSYIVRYTELKPMLLESFRDKAIRPEYLRAS